MLQRGQLGARLCAHWCDSRGVASCSCSLRGWLPTLQVPLPGPGVYEYSFFFFFKWRAEYFKQTLLNIYNLWARLQRRRSVAAWCRGWLSVCSSLPPLLFAVTWRGRRDEPGAAPRKFPAWKEEKPPVCLLGLAGASLSPLPSTCPRELHQDQGLSSKALLARADAVLVPVPAEPQLVPQAARGRVMGLFFNGSGETFASIN